jgi:hypothetical protein
MMEIGSATYALMDSVPIGHGIWRPEDGYPRDKGNDATRMAWLAERDGALPMARFGGNELAKRGLLAHRIASCFIREKQKRQYK